MDEETSPPSKKRKIRQSSLLDLLPNCRNLVGVVGGRGWSPSPQNPGSAAARDVEISAETPSRIWKRVVAARRIGSHLSEFVPVQSAQRIPIKDEQDLQSAALLSYYRL